MQSPPPPASQAGVRSIEHGNWLDQQTAELMVEAGAALVPTTITYAALRAAGVGAGMAPDLVRKVGAAVEEVGGRMGLLGEERGRVCTGVDQGAGKEGGGGGGHGA